MIMNKVVLASAGSGKTTYLVNQALVMKGERVLITTYTQNNEFEIRRSLIKRNGCIPEHIEIDTLWGFYLRHLIKPYIDYVFPYKDIKGINLKNEQSAKYIAESKLSHWFDPEGKVYSDKIAKLADKCISRSNRAVLQRLSKIYTSIYIDEVQDLSGYDLVIIDHLLDSPIKTCFVGDPRQGTYSTSPNPKYKKYSKSGIAQFFKDKKRKNLDIDEGLLSINHRCTLEICDLANMLWTEFKACKGREREGLAHEGVFTVRECDVLMYLQRFNCTQLRWDKRVGVSDAFSVYNFGDSKGLTFDRVLIYPTKKFIDWLKNKNSPLTNITKSKLYVALTRARHSVGIVYNQSIDGLNVYNP